MKKMAMRLVAAIPPVLLQVLWFLALVKWLAPWAAIINLVLSVLALLFVLYLITKAEESTYKILWLLVILTFPLPGALLYLLFGGKRTTRTLRVRLEKAQAGLAGLPAPAPCPPLPDPRLDETLRYLQGITGAALYPNAGATLYPLGDDLFPALLEAGVKIYEYTPGFVHAKGCVVDDTVATVGTVNLDYRSLFLHFENNALFCRAALVGQLKADFLATQTRCREMQLGDNVRRSFGSWLLDGVLRTIAPLC